ncbi:MAG: hypothetical protein AABX69_01985 [Nanoarchaeota archaeon]
MLATLKTKRYAKIIFGKMPITACNAAMSTAAAFPNAQTMHVTQKTKNGATTAYGCLQIIAVAAGAETFHAEPAVAATFATQHQTNGATMWHGNRWIIAGTARIQSAWEPVQIMLVILTQSNGATAAYGLLQIIAQYAEAGTLHAPQPAKKMPVIRHQIRGALTANGYY